MKIIKYLKKLKVIKMNDKLIKIEDDDSYNTRLY